MGLVYRLSNVAGLQSSESIKAWQSKNRRKGGCGGQKFSVKLESVDLELF